MMKKCVSLLLAAFLSLGMIAFADSGAALPDLAGIWQATWLSQGGTEVDLTGEYAAYISLTLTLRADASFEMRTVIFQDETILEGTYEILDEQWLVLYETSGATSYDTYLLEKDLLTLTETDSDGEVTVIEFAYAGEPEGGKAASSNGGIVGIWDAVSISMNGMEYSLSEYGASLTFEFYDDGSCIGTVVENSEESIGVMSYVVYEDTIVFDEDGEIMELAYTLDGDMLILAMGEEAEGGTYKLVRR